MAGSAYTLHAEGDHFGQLRTLVSEEYNNEQRHPIINTFVGSLLGGVCSPALECVFE